MPILAIKLCYFGKHVESIKVLLNLSTKPASICGRMVATDAVYKILATLQLASYIS